MRQFLLSRRVLGSAGVALLAAASAAAITFPLTDPGYLFYLPIALLALATGPRIGALVGAAGAGLYTIACIRLGTSDMVEHGVTRLITYSAIGALIGWSAASNRTLLARLRDHAERDFLTGLLNMRAFESVLARRIEKGSPFALLLGDVDRLKEVNDSLGHVEGNELLRRVARAIDETRQPEDDCARLGGDEFAIMSSLSTREETAAASRRFETIVAEREASITFGWAVFPRDGTDALALFHAADKRLYKGKLAVDARPAGGLLHRVS
jgi:diguanylate cyclase (GGDEF)-like protein